MTKNAAMSYLSSSDTFVLVQNMKFIPLDGFDTNLIREHIDEK